VSERTPKKQGSTIGGRLRSERERLELSQADLAAKLGVSRGTQFNYETDKGVPDAGYLLAFGESGADIGYLFSGERTTPKGMYRDGAVRVLPFIARRAEIDPKALMGIFDLAAEDVADEWARGRTGPDGPAKILQLVDALFQDGELLGKIFAYVAKTLHEIDASLPPAKRADIILSLYRISRVRGKLDTKMLEITVRAAA
jgi:transcriptional regulator with XRE-family HTH domain